MIPESTFRAILNTSGRRTSNIHSVTLKAVQYNGKIYFSRHMPNSDWFKNALANSQVSIMYKNKTYFGIAKIVQDENLCKKISQLKYPGENRAEDKRVVLEITLYE